MNFIKEVDLHKRFFKGSKRYFFSALGFPQVVRDEVAIVYNFCRMVDDSVDDPSHSKFSFDEIINSYNNSLKGKSVKIDTVSEFVRIKKQKNIRSDWIESLFNSMLMDLNNIKYKNLEDTLKYTYGVAEVIGLFMCKVLEINEKAYESARYLGRSAQWINFIRDINEDFLIGRVYFPTEDLVKFHLESLDFNHVLVKEKNFKAFINFQLDRYDEWLLKGEDGYKYIPRKYRKPIMLATELDKWKARKIRKNPLILYSEKVDPGYLQIIKYSIITVNPFRNAREFLLNLRN